ncbi:MAG: hypothetical protein N2322_04315 [Terrimicrobiaceae bacterium]|nr:hypothetical protein [Terrimicrobiaceae bacterium]
MSAKFYAKFIVFSLIGGICFVVFWPVGLVFAFLALMAFAQAKDAERGILPGDEIIHNAPEELRSMNFGPGGPPWGDTEEPLILEGEVIFPSSIRNITEWSARGPDILVRKGVETPIAGTEEPARVGLTLHSGETFSAYGEEARRLRTWFDRIPHRSAGSAQ